MSQNNYNQDRQEFEQFREKLYQSFKYKRHTVMELVDVIAANTTARSPVELSRHFNQTTLIDLSDRVISNRNGVSHALFPYIVI